MGKILVLFDSKTSHTQQMAAYVAEGAQAVTGSEVRLLSVNEATRDDVIWCDGLAVGSPTNMGVLSWHMKRFFDEECNDLWSKVDGKIACAFSSSGGWGGGAEMTCLSLLIVLMNFGFLVFGVTDYVANQHTLHYGAVTAGAPRTNNDMAACQRLGQRLAEWVAKYVDSRAVTIRESTGS